jgi:carboxyl-terminal processing protease
LFAQADKNPCETLLRINHLIQQQHYKAKAVNDSLSSNVFELFLKKLDNDNRLFTEIEINYLKKHKFKIDDYLRNENCNFLADFYQVYNYSVERYATLIKTITNEPFELNSSEKIQFSKKAFPYVKNEDQLKSLYKKRILFNILKDISEVSKNKDSLVANFEIISESSKNKIGRAHV